MTAPPAPIPAVEYLLESALYVDDVARSQRFYTTLFGFEVLVEDGRMAALAVAGRQVLLLLRKGGSIEIAPGPGGTIPGHDGDGRLHLAFAIPAEALDAWNARLEGQGLAVESRVRWPRGGTSLYFRDPDGHLVELATPGLWSIR